jgi:hypothetical protein
MEDCGGKGHAEEEAERGGGQEKGKREARQNPDDKEWWMGKELPPTAIEHHLQYEDMGRCRQERRNKCPDCAREQQSRTYNTDDEEGREARRGSTEADDERRKRRVRSDGKGQGRPGGDNQWRK